MWPLQVSTLPLVLDLPCRSGRPCLTVGFRVAVSVVNNARWAAFESCLSALQQHSALPCNPFLFFFHEALDLGSSIVLCLQFFCMAPSYLAGAFQSALAVVPFPGVTFTFLSCFFCSGRCGPICIQCAWGILQQCCQVRLSSEAEHGRSYSGSPGVWAASGSYLSPPPPPPPTLSSKCPQVRHALYC